MQRAMTVRWWSVLGGVLGLVVFLLIGCSPESGGGERTSQSMSRVSLQLMTSDQAFSGDVRGVEAASLLRQVNIARVRVEVTGEGILTPIVAECTLPQPTQTACRVVSQTQDSTTFEITLTIPMGPNRLVRVTAFDASGTTILLGRGTVNLTLPSQQIVIELDPAVLPSDLANQSLTFNDGAAFGLPGQTITLEFGAFTGTTGSVTLRIPATGGVATGTATVSSLAMTFNQITNIPAIPSGSSFSFDATLQENQFTLLNNQTGASSSAATNAPPVANDDLRSTLENTRITINVLTNDSDPEGAALSLTAITPPAHGTAVNNGDGTIDYTPNVDFNGTDTFTYSIRDTGGFIATATVTVEVLFDHFDLGFLDAMQWEDLEFVRKIQDGKLLSSIRRFGRFDPFDIGNRLAFADPSSFNSFKAKVTVSEIDNANAFPAAILSGSFYNTFGTSISTIGDILGVIGIGHNGTDLVGFFAVLQCNDDPCETPMFLHFDATTLGRVDLGTTHTLSLAWDETTRTFIFGLDDRTEQFDPTPLAPVVNPTPGRTFRDLKTQVFGLPNGIPNMLLDPAQGGSITATFDDVMVGSTLFDDFASATLDKTKWLTLEFVREVQNGKLVSSIRQSGPLGQEEEAENELEFHIPLGPTSFQAEVTVTEVTNAGSFPFAFLSGSFYNDGTGIDGAEGDVFAAIGIGHNGTTLIVFTAVERCDDEDCETTTLLQVDSTTLGTVALNTPHTLLLTWDGTVFTFGFDGTTTSFDPRSQAPVAGFPRDFFRSIGTRISGPLNGATPTLSVRTESRTNGLLSPLNPGEEGSITALFDNIQVFQRMPPFSTVTGQVVDENGNALASVSVTTNGGRIGVTDANGLFSIPGVPAGPDNIAASAAFTDPSSGITLTGSSFEVLPRFGETDVGIITVFAPVEDTVVLESAPFLIPAGMSSLKFEVNFLSNEFPDFAGETSQFDDTAFALVRSDGTLVETRVLTSVNVASFFPANGSGFNGQTGFQPIVFDVSSVAGSSTPLILVISVRDVGDSIVDSALLIDNFRLEDTNVVQLIPNGGFEAGNFTNFTVTFENVFDLTFPPMAAVLTNLGPIRPPQGNFMAFLSTGSEASGNIFVPPGVVITPIAQ